MTLTDHSDEPDWQPTPDQAREAAEWHDHQAYLAWCERHGLVPNDTTEEVYADELVQIAEDRADSHYGDIPSIGYHANPDRD